MPILFSAMIRPELTAYIEGNIIPRYAAFDPAHRTDHVRAVIASGLELARKCSLDEEMVYAAAAYHDTGLEFGRQNHNSDSAKIILSDRKLESFFSREQIETIAQAAEDHRASLYPKARSIYGKVVADADRQLDAGTIIRRTIQYGRGNYPALSRREHIARAMEHFNQKYSENGYIGLYFDDSQASRDLGKFRRMLKDTGNMERLCALEYDAQSGRDTIICLTGFMASGKSTVGRSLALLTGRKFLDLDSEIERSRGMSIPQIFSSLGEQEFRNIERECLREAVTALKQESVKAVIALGGGAFCQDRTRQEVLETSQSVYLEVPYDIINQRLGASDPNRPLSKDREKLYHTREPLYALADFKVDASSSDAALTARRIIDILSPSL